MFASPAPDPLRRRLRAASLLTVALGAAVGLGCQGGATRGDVTARDRAVAATDSSKAALQSNLATGTVGGRNTSLAQAEASAAKRAALRRAVLAARKEQDERFDRRGDDLTFLEGYRTDDRNDSVKIYLYGRALGKLQRLPEAEAEFEASILADESNPWPYEGLGICHFLNKQPDRAIASLKKALDVDPDLAEARFALARALESMNRMNEAVAEAELVVRNDDDLERGPLLVAELRVKRNELEKACAALAAAIARAPESVPLRLAYADALGRWGKPTEAASELDVALAKGNLPPEKLYSFAILYRKADRFDRALELLVRLLREAPPEYWRSHSREEVDQLKEKLSREQAAGHRLEYNVSELLQMLASHPDVTKRQFAMESLRQFPFPEVDQAFVGALRDTSPLIRAVAIPEVQRRAGDGAQKAFCKIAVADPDARVRAAACAALARMEGEETETTLVGALADPENMPREAANAALETLTGRIVRPAGIANLDPAGRKELQQEWRYVLEERRRARRAAGGPQRPRSSSPP